MTGNETLVPCSVAKCTSLKSGGYGQNVEQEITSIDFIGEYQAVNTESPFAIAASTGSKVSYDRTFIQDQPSTICLPFALTADELAKVGKAYTLSAVNDSKATFTPVTAIKAYTPYLLIPSDGGKLLENIVATKDITAVPAEAKTSVSGSYSFVGTLQAKKSVKTPNTEVYGFSANGGKFVRVGEMLALMPSEHTSLFQLRLFLLLHLVLSTSISVAQLASMRFRTPILLQLRQPMMLMESV